MHSKLLINDCSYHSLNYYWDSLCCWDRIALLRLICLPDNVSASGTHFVGLLISFPIWVVKEAKSCRE